MRDAATARTVRFILGGSLGLLIGVTAMAAATPAVAHMLSPPTAAPLIPDPTPPPAGQLDFWKAPFPIFNGGSGGKRDQFQHILSMAENSKTVALRGHYYRLLGDTLIKVGRVHEAYRAYEAGALIGDTPAADQVVKAYASHQYVPAMLGPLIDAAIMPQAQAGRVNSALMMATLIETGKLHGAKYQSPTYWLQKAAAGGSSDAGQQLARSAEMKGDIKTAAAYYAKFDRRVPRFARALREARVFFQGRDVKPNSKIAVAWLQFSLHLNSAATGKLAAQFYRRSTDAQIRPVLYAIAKAGGVLNPDGGGLETLLASATTDAQRQQIIGQIKQSADSGDAEAAAFYWKTMTDEGAEAGSILPYLVKSIAGKSRNGAEEALDLIARSTSDDPVVPTLVATLDAAGSAGGVDALKALGSLYSIGGPVTADADKSLAYYKRAADVGDSEAQLRVGLYFAQDQGAADGIDNARHYLKAAAAQGLASAKAYLEALPST